ncbi:MAG: CZB domain-containing protein, partial [Proteobacteria bacterium]|nr:CZB domain-containing protein [Pseudomonadota bacterium]
MSWWGSIFGSKDKEFQDVKEEATEEIAGLNFKTALEAHIKWKQRLKGVIDGSGTEVLDPRVVARDDQCALGKWIYTEGQAQFGNQPGFVAVVTAHTHFHKCAGNTLELALDGKFKEAE